MLRMSIVVFFTLTLCLFAGEYPKSVTAYRGIKPMLDGFISSGEWDDAGTLQHDDSWNCDAAKVTDPADLSMQGWVKHDGDYLYFAFDVTDNVIYGTDTEPWLSDKNLQAHELTQDGWPWFADGIEIFLNPENEWNNSKKERTKGDGTSWKMVSSTYKSRLGGVGTPGLLEGEPRQSDYAWNNYQQWILNGAQESVVRIKDAYTEGHGYIIEWKIKPDPCLEVDPGTFWCPCMGKVTMGLNIEIQDLDTKAAGAGNFANFHHIDYWAAEQGKKELLAQWGKIIVVPETKDDTWINENDNSSSHTFKLCQNFPNPFNPFTVIPFHLVKKSHVKIDVYSSAGKHVKTLWDQSTFAGAHHATWNGTDGKGKQCASGVYVIKMQSQNEIQHKRTVLKR